AADELVVTGTRIRGAAPAGAHVIVLDRTAIAESGAGGVEDLTRTLPQAFGGDIAQHVSFVGGNIGGGSAINLRGLGSDATLSLVNGRRVPVLGLRGSFGDISSIPVTAIERVEVLPDSASAIYGSDAVGGVVNFILRRDFEGVELGARYGGVTEGDLRETRIDLAAGRRFGALSVFAAYERFERTALAVADRAYLANSDLTALGGDNFSSTRANPASLNVSGLGAFAIPRGQDGASLTEADLIAGAVNYSNVNEGLDALPASEQNSVTLSARVDFSSDLEAYLDLRWAQRHFLAHNYHPTSRMNIPASNAFRMANGLFPGRTLSADYNLYRDLGPRTETGDLDMIDLAAGALWRVSETWTLEPSAAYARIGGRHRTDNLVNSVSLAAALASSDPNTAFNPFGDGSFSNPAVIEAIRGWAVDDIVSETWSVALKADGALLQLPAGPIRIAIGGDYRSEFYEVGGVTATAGPTPVARVFSSNGRTVTAAFGEVLVPLFGEGFRPPLGESLDLSLAARHERYSDFGETTNPKLGLTWQLNDALSVRASYGHAFRAPNLPDLDPDGALNRRQVRGIPITDPVSPSGTSQILFIAGANPNLREQTATSWSAGFDYDNRAEGLRFSLSYFDVRFSDRISGISNIAAAMLPNSEFASLVNRAPDPTLVAALLAEAAALGTDGGYVVADIDAIVDVRSTNLARTDVNGMDLSGALSVDLAEGSLELRGDATYLFEFLRAASPLAQPRDVVDTVGNPVDFRARLGLSWRTEHYTLGGFLNYMDGYRDNLSAPARRIAPWTTLDLHFSIALPPVGAADDVRLNFSLNNAFDEDPPFVNHRSGFGYDSANAHPLGRFAAIHVASRF
ncbi:MAG TPA: TonB-dependent receptor, partial [Terricaulis sp.]|nr:TonB-dependent receptor [Terricaulis sp.]